LITIDFTQSCLVDDSIAADNRISSFGNFHRLCLTVAVQDNDDILPQVIAGMILQTKSHQTVACRKELQMLPDPFSLSKTEGRVMQA
jgi:hypothetical protein